MRTSSHKYAFDLRSSEELCEVILNKMNSDEDPYEEIAILHFRGSRKEFENGKNLTENVDPDKLSMGANILAQLGWEEKIPVD